MEGELDIILLQNEKEKPSRMDQLWEHTCFEAFIALRSSSSYWELNVSPSGDWNLYRFSDYREGQIREEKVEQIQFNRSQSGKNLILHVVLDLKKVLPELKSEALDVGLTAVLETLDQKKSYWAAQHCGSKPDFHLRKSFCILL